MGAMEYHAMTGDPHFIYRFWLRRPRYLVAFLEAIDNSLDPKIYVDHGSGFDEGNSVLLKHADSCIYSISISSPRQVVRIRVDPCSEETRFRYWAGCAWSEIELAQLLAQAQKRAERSAPICAVVIDGTSAKRTKQKPVKRIDYHFASVIQLAERTAPPIAPNPMGQPPFISFIVPVYNTSERYLNDLLASFRRQPIGSAELILCDDGSTSPQTLWWLSAQKQAPGVRIVRNKENRGIALNTNSGIAVARGEWVSFIDHDDTLTPGTVQLLFQTAQEHQNCKFIYTDEVVTNERLKPTILFFKPAYDEVLLSGVNYINHLSCYRRDRLLALGGLRPGYDGSQDYDLLLRYVRDLAPDEIKHLPYPAYRWRRSARTFSAQFMDLATTNARKALAEHYRCGEDTPMIDEAISKNLHRVRFETLMARWPRVSIIIPNRDSFPLISRVLADLANRTSYPDFEIIVIDNGTTEPRVLNLYAKTKEGMIPFRFDINPEPFNFSRQVNRGIAMASGELILLLNNDIEVMEREWLREMVSCFSYPATGIVGARLLYPNLRLQHAGVIVGLGDLAGHWFGGKRRHYPGPMARLHVRQSLTAVTGACMLISRACLDKVGAFDEQEFGIAYNDIDFCLRSVAIGFRVVWTPFATMIHHESATRGSDETPANRDRFERDKESLRRRYNTDTFEDRAFSPWYARDRFEPAPILLTQLPKAR
jgi:GT2 family glycosyltransferase